MAPPAWLPPLNSHEHYHVEVKTGERRVAGDFCNLRRSGIEIRRTFFIGLQVYVDFYSETDVDMERAFPGFCLAKLLPVDVRTPESLYLSLHRNILTDQLIPFQLHSCRWTEDHLQGRPSPWLQLSSEEELCEKLFNFVRLVDCKPENDGLKLVAVNLVITKSVMVPEQEFASWVSWYEEQKRVHPEFEAEYKNAIGKPRDEDEVYEEEVSLRERRSARTSFVRELGILVVNGDDGFSSSSQKSCCICLEEFPDGARVIRLPCRHVFDEACIVRWLRGNHICPLCRYPLPAE